MCARATCSPYATLANHVLQHWINTYTCQTKTILIVLQPGPELDRAVAAAQALEGVFKKFRGPEYSPYVQMLSVRYVGAQLAQEHTHAQNTSSPPSLNIAHPHTRPSRTLTCARTPPHTHTHTHTHTTHTHTHNVHTHNAHREKLRDYEEFRKGFANRVEAWFSSFFCACFLRLCCCMFVCGMLTIACVRVVSVRAWCECVCVL